VNIYRDEIAVNINQCLNVVRLQQIFVLAYNSELKIKNFKITNVKRGNTGIACTSAAVVLIIRRL